MRRDLPLNRLAVSNEANGTQVWSNISDGATVHYRLTPVSQLSPGDRIESMQQLHRGPSGKLERGPSEGDAVVLTPPLIAAYPAGSFVRMREEAQPGRDPRPVAQGARP